MHVMPVGDLVEHETDQECVCVPAPRFEPGVIIYVHHSLDGRERDE